MPASSKKTPTALSRLRTLHAEGASDREIADIIGVHFSSVAEWRRSLGLPTVGVTGPRAGRQRILTTPEVRHAAAEAAERLVEAREVAPAGEGSLEVLARRLASVQASLDRLGPAVERDEYPSSQFRSLGAYERELVAAIAELTPPTSPDPERDPTNVEAADLLRARLARLVSVAEASSRCSHCGQRPFA